MRLIVELGDISPQMYSELIHHFEDDDGEGLTPLELSILTAHIFSQSDTELVTDTYNTIISDQRSEGILTDEGDILVRGIPDLEFLFSSTEAYKIGKNT